MTQDQNTAKGSSLRVSVIPLSYKNKSKLLQAYMPYIQNGGLFFPTNRDYQLNQEMFMLVTLPSSSDGVPIKGTVVWKTPEDAANNRVQGVGIMFKGREGKALKRQIESLLGVQLNDPASTYTL